MIHFTLVILNLKGPYFQIGGTRGTWRRLSFATACHTLYSGQFTNTTRSRQSLQTGTYPLVILGGSGTHILLWCVHNAPCAVGCFHVACKSYCVLEGP